MVATVPFWTDLALYGRSADGQWLYVETGDGVRAWISTLLISPSTPYSLAELPYAPGAGDEGKWLLVFGDWLLGTGEVRFDAPAPPQQSRTSYQQPIATSSAERAQL